MSLIYIFSKSSFAAVDGRRWREDGQREQRGGTDSRQGGRACTRRWIGETARRYESTGNKWDLSCAHALSEFDNCSTICTYHSFSVSPFLPLPLRLFLSWREFFLFFSSNLIWSQTLNKPDKGGWWHPAVNSIDVIPEPEPCLVLDDWEFPQT